MSYWPLDLKYGVDTQIDVKVFGRTLSIEPLNARTLQYTWADDADQSKLVGISPDADLVRLVPTIGTNPLLLFPRRTLLCPAMSKLKTVLRVPLFIEIGVGTSKDIRKITEILPPSTSRALYGPVDAGVLCTSIRSNVGVSVDELRQHAPSDDGESGVEHAPDGSGDDPEMTRARDLSRVLSEAEMAAYVDIVIRNQTEEPREVAKIMVPHDLVALYESDDVILSGQLDMKLLSEFEAELDVGPCPDSEAVPLRDLQGRRRETGGRKHLFDLNYRNKTGLEHGF